MPSSFFSFESHLSSTVPDNSILVISAALVILIFVILCVTILRIAYVDYRSWYGLDGGGLPHNVFGWVVQSLLRLFASKDTKSTFCYDDPKYVAQAGEVCTRSFLTASGGLEIRKGETPSIAKWVAPHRQLDQLGAEEMKELLLAELDSIKDCNKSILETGVSKLEGFCPAMFLRQNVPLNHKTVPRAPWEIAHIHDADGSLHMIISPGDAKMVVEKAWGERHPLSGRAGGVPITYTMIYAPRTEEEVKVQGRILRAAVWYGVEGREEIK